MPGERDGDPSDGSSSDACGHAARMPSYIPAPSREDRAVVLVVGGRRALTPSAERALGATYVLQRAASGAEAVACARARRPDLVVAAMRLPDVDAPLLCSALRGAGEMPIVLVSADSDREAHLQAVLAGADYYLSAPLDAGVLWAVAGRLVAQQTAGRERAARGPSPFLDRVRRAVHLHLADASFSVARLADEVALSTSQLYRRLRDEVGLGPSEFIRDVRLEEAAHLLRTSDQPVTDIAYATGFNSVSYFGRCFRRQFGVPPTEYRR